MTLYLFVCGGNGCLCKMGILRGRFHALSSAGKTEDWTGYSFLFFLLRRISSYRFLFFNRSAAIPPNRCLSRLRAEVGRASWMHSRTFSSFMRCLRRLFPMDWFGREGRTGFGGEGIFFCSINEFSFLSVARMRTNSVSL